MTPLYQLWSRRWARVGPASADRAGLEAQATEIADGGSDACVYEIGEDPNEEDDEFEWEVG